eukprot:12898250-Prorocentrum_lima.AAC.1
MGQDGELYKNIHWEIDLASGRPSFQPISQSGEIETGVDGSATVPRMGYYNGVLGHVVGILRAQSTVGQDDKLEL